MKEKSGEILYSIEQFNTKNFRLKNSQKCVF